MQKELLSIKEMASFLGVKEATIYSWVHQRRIPYYKIGRLVKFRISEAAEWLEDQKVQQRAI